MSFNLSVEMKPCPIHHLDLDEASKKHIGNLVVSNRSFVHDRGPACRTLGEDMKIYFFDKYNNRTSFAGDYFVTCSITRDAGVVPFAGASSSLPELVDANRGRLQGERLGNREGALFRHIQIVENSGEQSELLRLRFDFRPSPSSSTEANGNSSSTSSKTQMTDSDMVYEPIFIPFQFTTDQEMVIRLAELQAQLKPIKDAIVKLHQERQFLISKIHSADHLVEVKLSEVRDPAVRYVYTTYLSVYS